MNMTTNKVGSKTHTNHQEDQPAKKKRRPSRTMKDDARDSLVEFESSIFDASDGHKLVNFIRKKKGLCAQPQKIFDEVRSNRESLQIEILKLNEDVRPLEPENLVENETRPESPKNADTNQLKSPGKPPAKSPFIGPKLKRISNSIAFRTLIKEFEKTLQESRFLPETCSTPVSKDSPELPSSSSNAPKDAALSKTTKQTVEPVEKSINANLVCTPITISDYASTGSKDEKSLTKKSNTQEVMRELQNQNEILLELANSDEEAVDGPAELNITLTNNHDKDNPPNSPNRLQPIFNRTSTPLKKDQRGTYVVHREDSSGKLVLELSKPSIENVQQSASPETPLKKDQRRTYTVQREVSSGKLFLELVKPNIENVQQPASPKTPVKNAMVHERKLYATPKQKQLLLSRFNRSATLITTSPESVATVPKTSRIPVKRTIEFKAVESGSGPPQIETAVLNHDTSKIIEKLQEKTSSNAPIIVIPVSQTFNQGHRNKSRVDLESTANRGSPLPRDNTPNISKSVQQAEPIVAPSVNHDGELPINSLRLEDIITDDESNNSSENEVVTKVRSPSKSDKSSVYPRASELSRQRQRQLSLSRTSQRNSSHHIREVIKPSQLAEMNVDEILDLRKRNSRGQLRTTCQFSQRECSMLDKQVELELLRRTIQDKNYEDEFLQMEVLPPPPEEFCDARKSSQLQQSYAFPTLAAESDLEDEKSSDRILLSQDTSKRAKSMKTRKKKTRKMSEQMERYLEASQRVSQSKYLNLSKRKLYNKGHSDATSSDDSSPNTSSSRRATNNKTRRISRQSIVKMPLRSADSSIRNLNSNSLADLEKQSTNQEPSQVNDDQIFKKPVGRPLKKIKSVAKHVSQETKSPPKELFIPNNNQVFKKPTAQRPRKKHSKQSSLQVDTVSVSSISTSAGTPTRKENPNPPVDPDPTTTNIGVRRSTREKKPLTAYWSCSHKEYRPLYSIIIKDTSSKKKKSKDLPRNKDGLVDNTKAKKSNSVTKVQENKKSNKKLNKEHNSAVTKNQEEGKSKEQSTITSNQSSTYDTSICPPRLVSVNDESNMIIRQHDRDNSSDSNESDNEKTTSTIGQKLLKVNEEVSSECQSKNLQGQLTVITEGEELDANHTTRLADSEDFPVSKRKGKHVKKTQPLTNIRTSTKERVGPSKPKGKQSKALISSTRSQCTSSDCEIDENHSSIQQPRLPTIAEDSIPELTRRGAISISTSIKENDSNSGNKLTRLQLASFNEKDLKIRLKKGNPKASFRREHDESIADVSSVHVHKLFDQLKSSTMCAASDVTAMRVSCSGQNSVSRIQNQTAAVPILKNLTVRLMRVKNKKQITSQQKEKVCDSGFSSEDMSSDPKESGDILLNWLKQIVKSGNYSSGPQKGVARFLQADGFHVASIDELVFEEINGVEYAFYNTQQSYSFGYMRFNPNAEKKKSIAKKFELSFCIICGAVKITINGNPVFCKNGDLVTVFKGTSYGIKNCSNDPALVMVIRR